MTKAQTAPGPSPRARTTRPKKSAIKLPAKLRDSGDNPGNRHWRTYFLAHLVETSNISASAKAAGIATARAYRTRQDDLSEQEVLDSIDAMIDEMRERAAANSAQLNEREELDEQVK